MIYCVTSVHGIGCTFLDWSIHYLSGQTLFDRVVVGLVDLVTDPLSSNNAHKHPKNHPNGADDTYNTIRSLKQSNYKGLKSLYPTLMWDERAANFVGSTQRNDYIQYLIDDYTKIWDVCAQELVPLVFIDLTRDYLYLQSMRGLEKKFFTNSSASSIDEIRESVVNHFFERKHQHWQGDSNFNNVWDYREFLALNLRPFDCIQLDANIFTRPHFYANSNELWFNGEQLLLRILDFLKLDLDKDRLLSWRKIYLEWQKFHVKTLNLSWNIDHICESIVNDYSYNLNQHHLDLWHEAIIQHILIYRYNLNLKTWQLEKFPANTRDLHTLLEENIHPVEDIYNIKGTK